MGLVRQINIGSDVGYLLREPPDIISIVSVNNIEYKWIKYRYKPARYFIINKYFSQGPVKNSSISDNNIYDCVTITFSNNSQLTASPKLLSVPTLSILPSGNFFTSQDAKVGYYYVYNRIMYIKALTVDTENERVVRTFSESEAKRSPYFNDRDYQSYNPNLEFNCAICTYIDYDGEY